MNPLPHAGRDVLGSVAAALAAALLATAAPAGCGPPDAGTIKGPSGDELSKAMFPEGKTRSGKKVEGGGQSIPAPPRR